MHRDNCIEGLWKHKVPVRRQKAFESADMRCVPSWNLNIATLWFCKEKGRARPTEIWLCWRLLQHHKTIEPLPISGRANKSRIIVTRTHIRCESLHSQHRHEFQESSQSNTHVVRCVLLELCVVEVLLFWGTFYVRGCEVHAEETRRTHHHAWIGTLCRHHHWLDTAVQTFMKGLGSGPY